MGKAIRIMSRLRFIFTIVFFLFLFGLSTQSRAVLMLILPLAVYLGASLLAGPQALKLEVRREIEDTRVGPKTTIEIHLVITNYGSDLEEVQVEDIYPVGLELVDGSPKVLGTLPAGETLKLQYRVRARRGWYDFNRIRITARDYLGLFQRETELPAPGKLISFPEVSKLRRIPIRPLQTHGFAGPIPAGCPGSGIDFFGVREYHLGDPRNHINWRLSARQTSRFFTNEFEAERIADVVLILDARQAANVAFGNRSLFEYAIRASASLAEIFLADGNRLGLLIFGKHYVSTLPGYGRVQREKIMHTLSQAQELEFRSLDFVPTHLFPFRSQIVIISPLIKGDTEVLIRLRARGYQVLLVSPNPIQFERSLLDLSPRQLSMKAIKLGTRIAHLERKLMIRKLQQAGIQVADWSVDQDLNQALQVATCRLLQPPQPYLKMA